jgi:hypothetical protein
LKEAEERERQRKGEAPTNPELASRFKEKINDPEIVVASTHSGSMTQEMFFLFSEHFIKSLPENSGPVILLLDGHGSRWSVPALQLLMAHNIYPFIIASHTSIWAQPNDAGVNKRFHWAIEQAARQSRRAAGIANLAYFNEIFLKGWQIFIRSEISELRALGFNNTTTSYERTGMQPFNPYGSAWTDAIETLGTGIITPERQKVQYEIYAINNAPTLSREEKVELREGLNIDPNIDQGDAAVALIRGEEILKMWRSKIEFGVSQGNDYVAYAKSLSPISEATTKATKVAIKLINFQLVDISKVELPEKLTKEQKAAEFTLDIVRTTKLAEPIILSYLYSDEHSTTEDEQFNSEQDESTNSGQWLDGSAVKITAKKWRVTLRGKEDFHVEEEDLLDSKRFKKKMLSKQGAGLRSKKRPKKRSAGGARK